MLASQKTKGHFQSETKVELLSTAVPVDTGSIVSLRSLRHTTGAITDTRRLLGFNMTTGQLIAVISTLKLTFRIQTQSWSSNQTSGFKVEVHCQHLGLLRSPSTENRYQLESYPICQT